MADRNQQTGNRGAGKTAPAVAQHCEAQTQSLQARRLGLDTHHEPVLCLHRDSAVAHAEGFAAMSRVRVRNTRTENTILATLLVVHDQMVQVDEAGLSETAWGLLHCQPGDALVVSHPRPLHSFSFVRAKLYGNRLSASEFSAIIKDISTGRYSDVQLTGFVTACANKNLNRDEIVSLTRAMADAGDSLSWPDVVVADKHCIGGLPGNRTTPIVVSLVAAAGITIPKTSSRAITSPAGTADTMETLTCVELNLDQITRVVADTGGCLVWGGAMNLSPADDMLIRIERALDLDSEGQLIASVLSKKYAAGSNHVLIDIPVGPSVKARSPSAGEHLAELFTYVGSQLGLTLRVITSDGRQPIGRGIGPALEARDVLAVLNNHPDAPEDLRDKSLHLASAIIALCRKIEDEPALALVEELLSSGQAWQKFIEICEAQGGLREPPVAPHTLTIESPLAGVVSEIDNRRISRLARLAGAPGDAVAGMDLLVRLGDNLERGQPLFTLHSQSPGELQYALAYYQDQDSMIQVSEGP